MMHSIFELAIPRDEVLHGELSEEMFAARLKDVMDGTAEPVYQDPQRFFANTYPTAGLRSLLREVLGRLTGASPTNNPVLRLETSFGGGKTHNLIALYHAVRGEMSTADTDKYLDQGSPLPQPGTVKVVGVVGSDLDPANGVYHADGNVRTYTLWGELAYQLGGATGYNAEAQSSDVSRAAPGTGLLQRLIGDQPTLIMVDEIARHLRAATALPTASGESNQAEQTVAFLMSLMEYAASQSRVLVVLTMAGGEDAFAAETEALHQALHESLQVAARQERVLTPTGENEIAAIVVHRLFQHVDRVKAKATVGRYGAYYQELAGQGAAIHERSQRADYLREFELSYPFHPELIRALNLKVATIPNFQRTRGALRLLAASVRQLWKTRPAETWLIHPHHIDLGLGPIVEDLTSRLDRPRFKQVSEADIVSPMIGIPAHAAEADEPLVAAGKPPYARRLGTTIFLHSLTQGIASGIETAELMLAVLTPADVGGDDPAVVQRALERLYGRAWFLEFDGFRYRFKTEPSLNKIIDDETGSISITRTKQEIDSRIRGVWHVGYLKPVFFPNTPGDLDDDAGKPKLAILHYDALSLAAGNTEPPDLVRRMAQLAGLNESFRNYANNVLFLVADSDQVEQMVSETRRFLAIERITSSPERMREFNQEHQKKLRELKQAAELNVRVAITKAYRYLFYPTADASKEDAFLRRESVPAQGQGETNVNHTDVIVRLLHNLEKVRTGDDNPQPAAYVKSKTWDRNTVEMTTEDLRRAFARKVSLPLLLDVTQLQRTIENGIKTKQWIYYDSRNEWAYDHESPAIFPEVSENAHLYALAEAERLKLKIKGKWQPPVQPAPEPGNGATPDEGRGDEPPADLLAQVLGAQHVTELIGIGLPQQAFNQLRDLADEHHIAAVRSLELRLHGLSAESADSLVGIGLAIPQMGKAKIGIGLKLAIQFAAPPAGDRFQVDFQGDWERYKRLKPVVEGFVREQVHSRSVDLVLNVDFERDVSLADPQLETIRMVLDQMVKDSIKLIAVPASQVQQAQLTGGGY